MERAVRVQEFTQPGDPLRLDYAYRANGTRGYLHAVALARDPAQAKVLAYTAECIRARQPNSEFVAITEVAPSRKTRVTNLSLDYCGNRESKSCSCRRSKPLPTACARA
jgi:hypothetical protein